MLVYQATKREFMDDVDNDAITSRITEAFEQRIHRANASEVRSWTNSMQYMHKVLNTAEIPDGCGVAIEFGVPYTSSRIDFLLTGRGNGIAESPPRHRLRRHHRAQAVRVWSPQRLPTPRTKPGPTRA
ncbi:MAG: hypothetical protein U1E26_08130 [Coriobacteriia bacterium]|nr:hypothetical protein [Coriobacteriia bacterium]